MLKLLGLTLLASGGLYLLMVVILALFQRGMIYYPDPKRGDPAESGVPEMVPVPLRADDGWPVAGWYAPPRTAGKPTIVFFHGNSGTIASCAFKARILLDSGYGVFLLEYRGYGGSPGRPSEKGLYADGRAAISWLIARGIPASRIVLYGESLGSGVAMEMTRLIEPMMVVLECPFTSLPDLAPPYVIPGLAHMLMVDRYDNLAKVKGIRAPLLIVHGDKDETVPVAMGRALLKAAGGPKVGAFLPDAHHNDLWEQGADNHVLDFLSRRHEED